MRPYLEPNTKEQLDFIVNEIIKIVEVDEIILFGSYACGIPHEFSDYDICIVTDTVIESGSEISIQIVNIPFKGEEVYKPHEPNEEEMAYITEAKDPWEAIARIDEITAYQPKFKSPFIRAYYVSRKQLYERSKVENSIESIIIRDGVWLYTK